MAENGELQQEELRLRQVMDALRGVNPIGYYGQHPRPGTTEGKDLLLACLNAVQRKEWEDTRIFHVTGSNGGVYEVDCSGRMWNVFNRAKNTSYCVFLPNSPWHDTLTAQKLLMESDEDTFLRIANHVPRKVAW